MEKKKFKAHAPKGWTQRSFYFTPASLKALRDLKMKSINAMEKREQYELLNDAIMEYAKKIR